MSDLTTVEQALREVVNKKCQDPQWAALMSGTLAKLNAGFYDSKYVDVIMQNWGRYPYSIYDAYAFIHVWNWMNEAKIVVCEVNIGETPKRDYRVKDNNEILQNLAHGIVGEFWGGTQDEDGYIKLTEPLILDMKSRVTGKINTRSVIGNFPLEVGYTSAVKTMFYLNGTSLRLARWPYESESIYLMQRIEMNCLKVPYIPKVPRRNIPKQFNLFEGIA